MAASSSLEECRSPVWLLDCCSCCLDLEELAAAGAYKHHHPGAARRHFLLPPRPGRRLGSPFQQLRRQLACESVNADQLRRVLRQEGSLEPVVRDPCYLLKQGIICNRNIDQTLLAILLFFHRWVGDREPRQDRGRTALCKLRESRAGAGAQARIRPSGEIGGRCREGAAVCVATRAKPGLGLGHGLSMPASEKPGRRPPRPLKGRP